MKMINKITTVIFVLFGMLSAFAAPELPPPSTAKNAGVNAVPPPPPLPVDSYLLMLMVAALLLGVYIIYMHKLNTKASV